MGKRGPLDHPRLLEIEQALDEGALETAQKLLAALGDVAILRDGTTYLATRMLFLRGRIGAADVAARLRDLVIDLDGFPEARRLLELASRRSEPARSAAQATTDSQAPPAADAPQPPATWSEPDVELTDPISLEPRRAGMRASDEVPEDAVEFSNAEAPRAVDIPILTGAGIPKAPALPVFTENPGAPSYAPEPVRRAEREPRGAGTYSTRPPDVQERVTLPSSSPRAAPPPSQAPAPRSQRHSETPWSPRPAAPATESDRVASVAPVDATDSAPPTAFEIAALLDLGRAREAVARLRKAGPPASAEVALWYARALEQSGEREAASAEIGRLEGAPLLDPELRAGLARFLVERGEYARALGQARVAHDDDPETASVNLALALALVRAARHGGAASLLAEAEHVLGELRSRDTASPALAIALRAVVQAEAGDEKRAIDSAVRALKLDGDCIDALSALAIASARAGQHDEIEALVQRVSVASAREADALRARLAAHGYVARQDRITWPPPERALAAGRREEAARALSARFRDVVAQHGQAEGSALAALAARTLSTEPVWQAFGPYDRSLWSIARVSAVLTLLYGRAPRRASADDDAVITLVGAYVGDSLRVAHDGQWSEGRARRVLSASRAWEPLEIVSARLHEGAARDLDVATGTTLADPDSPAWLARVECDALGPAPWHAEWPALDLMPDLDRALRASAVGRFADELVGRPLDGTLASLDALDAYLALVAPLHAPLGAEPSWGRRVALLVGAYVGETLIRVRGGKWREASAPPSSEASYRVELGRLEVTPVAQAFARVTGQSPQSLADYAARLTQRAG